MTSASKPLRPRLPVARAARRALCLAGPLALLGTGPGARAQPAGAPRALAVLSEVAREVSVTIYQPSVGSRIGNDIRQRIAVPEGALDKVVLISARKAILAAEPQAVLWLVAPADTDIFDSLQSATEGSAVALAPDMAAALRDKGSTQVLLFSRYRAEARLQATHSREGSGLLEGLGYYVDRQAEGKITESGEWSKGFIAPYVYLRATLIDVASARVLRTRTVTVGTVVSSPDTTAGTHVWDAWSAAEKMSRLRDLLQQEIARVVPELLGPP